MTQKSPENTAVAPVREGALARWSPWDEMADIRHRMDELFSRAFGYTPLSRMMPADLVNTEPEVDIYEKADSLEVLASLPGYKPDEIKVEATADTISIEGERKPLFEDEKAVPHRRSWFSGASSFRVSYSLPCEIEPKSVKAEFKHGVLTLTLPKTTLAKNKAIEVKVNPAT